MIVYFPKRPGFISSIIFSYLNQTGKEPEVRFVGGCVRKILNNEIVDDLDLAINLEPSDVKNILKNL